MHLLIKSPYGPIWCVSCCREREGHSGIKAAQPLNYLHGLAGHWQPEKGKLSPDFCLPYSSPHKKNLTCGQSPGSGTGSRWGRGGGQRDYYKGISSSGPQWTVECVHKDSMWDYSVETGEEVWPLTITIVLGAFRPLARVRLSLEVSQVNPASGRWVWSPTLLSERQGRAIAQVVRGVDTFPGDVLTICSPEQLTRPRVPLRT